MKTSIEYIVNQPRTQMYKIAFEFIFFLLLKLQNLIKRSKWLGCGHKMTTIIGLCGEHVAKSLTPSRKMRFSNSKTIIKWGWFDGVACIFQFYFSHAFAKHTHYTEFRFFILNLKYSPGRFVDAVDGCVTHAKLKTNKIGYAILAIFIIGLDAYKQTNTIHVYHKFI